MAPAIAALINDAQVENKQTRKDLAALQAQLEEARSDLNEQKLLNVGLQAQINGALVLSRVQRLCAFGSPVAFGVAIDLHKATNTNLALLVAGLGILLLFANFIPGKKTS